MIFLVLYFEAGNGLLSPKQHSMVTLTCNLAPGSPSWATLFRFSQKAHLVQPKASIETTTNLQQ